MGIELPTPQGEAHTGPNAGAERAPAPYTSERLTNPIYVERNAAERPAVQEVRTGAGVGDNTSTTVSADVNDATTSQGQPVATAVALSLDDVPVVAADEDLIEKQWVDSAKRIIKQTNGDPYEQGKAISRLQADYLQKRYGKVLPGNDT